MLYDYLDFVTTLKWGKAEPEHIDLDEAESVLEEDHFGLDKVKHRIIQQIAVMELQKKQTGSILLFVGAPGTGKTSIGRSIARGAEAGIRFGSAWAAFGMRRIFGVIGGPISAPWPAGL